MAESSKRPAGSLRQDAINLPNLLTMLRVVLIPVVLWLLNDATPRSNFYAAVVYVICTVTDFLDGFLARRMGIVSLLGQFLDPLADKLLAIATLVFLAYQGRVPLLGAIAVIIVESRELSITSLRVIAMGEGVSMPAQQGGKEKAALQMIATLLLIIYYRYDTQYYGFGSISTDMGQAGLALLYLSTLLSLLTGADYIRFFVEAIDAKDRRLAESREMGE